MYVNLCVRYVGVLHDVVWHVRLRVSYCIVLLVLLVLLLLK